MSKAKINNPADWNMTAKYLQFNGIAVAGNPDINVADVVAASKVREMATLPKGKLVEGDKKLVLGACWDACVSIRERLVSPMNAGYKEIKVVSDQVKAHLGDELFELFLRPNNTTGLPPANA